MKYFLDTEFIESFNKPFFGKRRHFIDLISIGIVAEDGREYHAISNEFNPKDADKWVVENVISKLPEKRVEFWDSPRMRADSLLWKSNRQIRQDLYEFFGYKPEWTDYGSDLFSSDTDIQIYGYYSDYDWVLFCSLFGRMINLPKGFPMYCHDLKQEIDRIARKWQTGGTPQQNLDYNKECEKLGGRFSIVFNNKFDDMLKLVKDHKFYPKQINEHNALDDAKWNFDLYKFLLFL